jgi:hypothetical protein
MAIGQSGSRERSNVDGGSGRLSTFSARDETAQMKVWMQVRATIPLQRSEEAKGRWLF